MGRVTRSETPIAVFIGCPGAGKSTIDKLINMHHPSGCTGLDADQFISEAGNKALTDGTWNDNHRREYLSAAAAGVTNAASQGERVALLDAMTFGWMREFFAEQVESTGHSLVWVHVRRDFKPGEIEKMVRERAAKGHPITNPDVFKGFVRAFEPLQMPHLVLRNPGPEKSEKALLGRVRHTLSKIYQEPLWSRLPQDAFYKLFFQA